MDDEVRATEEVDATRVRREGRGRGVLEKHVRLTQKITPVAVSDSSRVREPARPKQIDTPSPRNYPLNPIFVITRTAHSYFCRSRAVRHAENLTFLFGRAISQFTFAA